MKSDSPLSRPHQGQAGQDRRLRADSPARQWPSCDAPATDRRPGASARTGVLAVLVGHVREYNHCLQFLRRHEQPTTSLATSVKQRSASADMENGHERRRPTMRSHSSRFRAGSRRSVRRVPEFGGAAGAARTQAAGSPGRRAMPSARRSMRRAGRRRPAEKVKPASRRWSSATTGRQRRRPVLRG